LARNHAKKFREEIPRARSATFSNWAVISARQFVKGGSVREVIKFDMLGEVRVEFDEVGVTYHATDKYFPVPSLLGMALTNLLSRPIPYGNIRWIGCVRKRQWWALILGVAASLFAILGIIGSLRQPGGLVCFLVGFLLLGVFPLWIFYQGRPFLVVRSDAEAFCIPMDRQKKQVRRVIDTLRATCPPTVEWSV